MLKKNVHRYISRDSSLSIVIDADMHEDLTPFMEKLKDWASRPFIGA
jgi:hypothetical protein